MEPAGGRLALQVLGESEALQQFFSGQDANGVLDSSVVVDTSILEQYLSTDVDPSNFLLPESPPDSSSETCSPSQIPEGHYERSYWSNPGTSSSSLLKDGGSTSHHSDLLTHDQLRQLGFTNTSIKAGMRRHPHQLLQPPETGSDTPPTPPFPPWNGRHVPSITGPVSLQVPSCTCLQGSAHMLHTCSLYSKKRRRSGSDESSLGLEVLGSHGGDGARRESPGSYQLLTWDQYIPEQWSGLYDSSYQTLSPPAYHVDTDKGFHFSLPDDAFVCQKKNHFQISVHIGVAAEPKFVRTSAGPQTVDHFLIRVFGLKLEAPTHLVTIEQSQPDRSKKPFNPIRVNLPAGKVTKVTLGRLHFSETTSNNMRKKGKPHPEQRYFQMVVGLYAAVREETCLLTALISQPIIVRASNPGQFETDSDTVWQRGAVQDAVVYQGCVGINTDAPDEALVVCGNTKVMGSILQPSDHRAKRNIVEVDSEQQLKRITQMRIVEFDYKQEFASTAGIDSAHHTGIIAQEVKELLPSAVKEVGDVTCSDGHKIQNFLMVDKEQIFMENVGAVQQLSKLTDNLETRIKELELWNRRLAKLKSLRGSVHSTGKCQKHGGVSQGAFEDSCKTDRVQRGGNRSNKRVQHKVLQATIFTLLSTMAFCVISITALYLLNLKEVEFEVTPDHSNGSIVPQQTTVWPTTAAAGSSNMSILEPESHSTEKRKEKLYEQLKSSRDWTNTTIHTFMIKESQQVIDSKYCLRDECGPGRFVFRVPISQFVSVDMRVTLLMNSAELLVVHLCHFDESADCSSVLDFTAGGSRYPSNTQGRHAWPLHVARLHHSSYHFRSAVAGQADCSTDHHFEGALFTDYYFHFYRHCTDS